MYDKLFQSPPSVRKATLDTGDPVIISEISIPAFREEGDFCNRKFRPRPNGFQSPPSVRKATRPARTVRTCS